MTHTPQDVLHQPTRLRIMRVLMETRSAAFGEVRRLLGLTDGALATHVGRLVEAGLVESRRVLTKQGFSTRLHITPQGSEAFGAYVRWLRTLLAHLESDPSPGSDWPGGTERGEPPST